MMVNLPNILRSHLCQTRNPEDTWGLACVLAAALAIALVAGCAETERPTPAVQPSAPAAGAPTGSGIYKIGKPYQVLGVWYYPAVDYGYSETGIASWYGSEFHGKVTANGEVYDMKALTAAHRTLPLPSLVEVTNLENGRSLVLRVNDRGPFARGRIIDVSRRAAKLLGFYEKGTAKVRVAILPEESLRLAALAQGRTPGFATATAMPAVPREEVVAQPLAGADTTRLASLSAAEKAPPVRKAAPEPAGATLTARWGPEREADGRVRVRDVEPTRIYVQAGAFINRENADRLRLELSRVAAAKVTAQRVGKQQFYRVRLGPLDDVEDADHVLETIASEGYTDARIVVD